MFTDTPNTEQQNPTNCTTLLKCLTAFSSVGDVYWLYSKLLKHTPTK